MEWLTHINNFVWGPCMLVLLFGTGLYLTIGLRFFTIRNFARGMRHAWAGRGQDAGHGEISPFNALMTALAGDIGTGNIVGVATAIYMGGPGALFWMWMTALVGMATKFSEVLLAVHFRERTPAGNWVGGAMFFIKNGLGRRWMWLGSAFALFGIVACIGTGAMVQSNAIGGVLDKGFGVSPRLSAAVLLVLSGMVLLGGVKRIAAVAGKVVPAMALCYAGMSLVVIAMHLGEVPGIFAMVIREAFTPTAAQGGAAGASVMMAIRMGMARGIFSNEAGLGTAPMAHAAASTRSPMTQATIGMLDTFIDTIVVCSLTAFALLLTGEWCNGEEGAAVTSAAFESVLPGVGGLVVALCLSLFAFTTAMSWCVYGERCAIYFFGDRAQIPFRVVYCLAIPVGVLIKLDLVWLLADTCNALMAIPNLIA
ncbi:sodium:alanine symporter family protein, partial [Mailhella massiliensis]